MRCTKCSIIKPLGEFFKRASRPLGVSSHCKACLTDAHRSYVEANREKVSKYQRARNLQKSYGISVDEWDAMFAKQSGRCAVCSVHQSETRRRFDVDHNHGTEQVRSLLCEDCNKLIGLSHEDPLVLRQAAEYLERHRGSAVVLRLAVSDEEGG